MTMQVSLFADQEYAPVPVRLQLPISQMAEQAVQCIESAMINATAVSVGVSYGKDSSVVLGLTLQAARNLADRGIHRRVIVLTSDTLVENPSVIRLAHRMSEQMLAWADRHGLDVEQQWVKPDPSDHYLVTMIGGRGVASIPGAKATCTMDLKIRPMEKFRKALAREVGAENILTLIGTRFDESNARGARMRDRGESATVPQQTDSGSWLLSPIADWTEGDVWAFLNAGPQRLGFDTLDFSATLALYETFGESTCSIGAIDPAFGKSASSCGGNRTGCWTCQKVSRDHSLEGMIGRFPVYEPLVRLSRVIRAGHFVPANRSFLSKSISPEGAVKVFANGYSAQWTASLLKWTLSIDAREDDRANKTGKARRFPRLLDMEHLILIGFNWARYGQHQPGEFIRIYDAIQAGARYPLPTDEQIAALEQASDRSMIGKTFGEVKVMDSAPEVTGYQDGWRTVLSGLSSFDADQSACAVPVMNEETYISGKGMRHDAIMTSDLLSVNLGELVDDQGEPTLALHDFMWWWEIEFGQGNRTHSDEMNWLLRQGIIQARRGYQGQIVRYQQYATALMSAGLQGSGAQLTEIIKNPGFTPAGERENAQLLISD